MKVYYSPYRLTPLKVSNRLSSLNVQEGVLLKGVLGNKVTFCDYFPHVTLGDKSVDEILQIFKFQENSYEKKCFDFLLRDHELYWTKPKLIKNHKLWNVGEELAPAIKYKVKDTSDFGFMHALKNKIPTRLDANGLFSRNEFLKFVQEIPQDLLGLIEYIEDPLYENDWSGLPLKTAKDFIEASPYEYVVYKPNAEFKPLTDLPVIFSTYLGHNLGRWHAYCELLREGDLALIHGIQTEGFYREEVNLFDGNYFTGFSANQKTVHKMYKEISGLNWKSLCSM